MQKLDERDADRAAACRAAIDRLPVVTRTVFVAHRQADLAYGEIACRLSIDPEAVEACIAEALFMVSAMLGRRPPERLGSRWIAEAEVVLHRRHRSYCEATLRAAGITQAIVWRGVDDDACAVSGAALAALPNQVLTTYALARLAKLIYLQPTLRMRLFKWVAYWRTLRTISQIVVVPDLSEE